MNRYPGWRRQWHKRLLPWLALPLAVLGFGASPAWRPAAAAQTADDTVQAAASQGLEPVTLQLRWRPQFQFAGYFAALWNGYYHDAGLNVTIRSGVTESGRVLSPETEVIAGRADFGIGASNILIARDKGADLVILESIFQTSPAALYVRTSADYHGLSDLSKLPLMWSQDPEINVVIKAMLHAQGLPFDDLTTMPRDSRDLSPAQAVAGHGLSTPLALERRGIDVLEVKPRHYGVEFYGDSLFTTRQTVEQRTDLVQAFSAATVRGWRYAIEHPDAIARRLSTDFPSPPQDPPAAEINRFQIGRTIDLTGHPLIELGHINTMRWRTMHQTLREMGLVHGIFDAEALIYDRGRLKDIRNSRLHHNMLGTLAFLAVLLLVVAIFAVLLRQAVATRTRELAESEERYRLLIDNMQGYAIYALDAEGRVASWPTAAAAISGFTRDDALGQPYDVMFRPQDREAGLPTQILARARREGRVEQEGWRRTKDGRDIWVHMVISPVFDPDGRLHGYATVTRDMTGYRTQQERIMFQATLLNRVRAAVIATDEAGRIVYMNAYAEALFLLPWRDAAGRRLSEVGILPDAGEQCLRGGERHEREVGALRKDGRTFPALCISSMTSDPSGQGHTEIHVIHDLTDRKRMEDALQHASNLALLGRMSASLVHEISQPMNVIRLTAEGGLLRLGRQSIDAADLEKRLRTIADQAARLFDTIDLMQAFSRRDAAETGRPTGRFDVIATIDSVIGEVRDRFARSSASLDADLPAGPLAAAGRRRQFEQVVQNLLSNALHALASLPADVPRNVRLRLRGPRPDDPAIVLTIEDSGPGIPSSRRSAIFEPFYTTKPPGQGTGLGLYISLGLVRAMQGDLQVGESALGGALFTIRLPVAPADGPQEGPPALPQRPGQTARSGPHADDGASDTPAPTVTSPRQHLLVVDDESLALDAISDSLRDHGYEVSVARSGKEALAVLQRHNGATDGDTVPEGLPVDAVITDIRMPGGSGVDLIRRMAEDYPQVFTLVMTGQPLADREDIEEIGGADAVLRKPISIGELEERLSALLDAGTDSA